MDINKLAILANQLGGYDGIESAIGLDAELAQRAVQGGRLSGLEQAEVETAFNQLYLDRELANDLGINVRAIEELASDLSDTVGFFYDVESENKFRAGVAEGVIDANDLSEGGTIFANLTSSQIETIISMLDDTNDLSTAKDFADMFKAYIDDYESGLSFWDITESEFWEWFRDTFYPE